MVWAGSYYHDYVRDYAKGTREHLLSTTGGAGLCQRASMATGDVEQWQA